MPTLLDSMVVQHGATDGVLAVAMSSEVPAGAFILPTGRSAYSLASATGALSSSTVTPLAAGTIGGQMAYYVNVGADTLTIKAGGNLLTPAGADIVLTQYDCFSAIWHTTLSQWVTASVSTNA